MAVTGKKKIFDSRYDIYSIVGRGSRSVVYHAANINDSNSSVALKVLVENKKDKTALSEKLRREALALVSCHHPSVIRLDDFHSVGDICYLAMEYAAESDLRKYMQSKNEPLPIAVVESFLYQIADGLDYIHRTGIIHRDIKPENLLVVSEKEIRIGDFGVAFLPGDTSNTSELQNAVGTMDYMAPEVLQGIEYTQRSDIYSLGVTFYEALCGKNPFENVSMAKQLEVRKDLPLVSTLRSDVPEYLAQIIAKACAFEPSNRFSSAKELLTQIKTKRPKSMQSSSAEQPKEEKTENTKSSQSESRPQLTVITGNAGAATDTPEEPKSTEAESNQGQINDIDMVAVHTQNIDSSNINPAGINPGAIPLKDSRASRTQTVFISKDSVEKVRGLASERSRPNYLNNLPSSSQINELLSIAFNKFNSLSNGALFGLGLAGLVVLYLLFGGKAKTSNYSSAEYAQMLPSSEQVPADRNSSVKDVKNSLANQSVLVPSYQGEALAFPQMPAGIYSGIMTGIFGSGSTSLTAMSIPNQQKIVFLIGADGMNPSIIKLNADNKDKVKVIANGIVLELQGTVKDNSIVGTVKNISSGTVGGFRLRPAA